MTITIDPSAPATRVHPAASSAPALPPPAPVAAPPPAPAAQVPAPVAVASPAPSAGFSPLGVTFTILAALSAAAAAYHGYKRNQSIGWALVWGAAGSAFPVITPAIALAQGFGKVRPDLLPPPTMLEASSAPPFGSPSFSSPPVAGPDCGCPHAPTSPSSPPLPPWSRS